MIIERESSQCVKCLNEDCSCTGKYNKHFDGVKHQCTSYLDETIKEKKRLEDLKEDLGSFNIFDVPLFLKDDIKGW